MSTTLAGLGCAFVAAIFYGTVFVPIKKFPSYDGFVAQLFLCFGCFVVCVITYILDGCPQFYPLAMIGGMLWCIGNALAIPIINNLGMALGILIWNTFSCLTGWATQRFGLFGLTAVEPESIPLNYVGIACLLIGGATYTFVKSEVVDIKRNDGEDEDDDESYYPKKAEEGSLELGENEKDEKSSSSVKKVLGIIAAIVSGLFYGNLVTPVTYMMSHPETYPNAPQHYLPYFFSIWTGVMIMSIIICVSYSLVRKNNPIIEPHVLCPAFVAGLIVGIGNVAFLYANQLLSQSVAFPVCIMAPGFVTTLWSTLYFKEITGKKNLIVLGIAYFFTLVGVILVTVSKDYSF